MRFCLCKETSQKMIWKKRTGKKLSKSTRTKTQLHRQQMLSRRFQQLWLVFQTQPKEDSTTRRAILRFLSSDSQTAEVKDNMILKNSIQRICFNISSLAQICLVAIDTLSVGTSKDNNTLGRSKDLLIWTCFFGNLLPYFLWFSSVYSWT